MESALEDLQTIVYFMYEPVNCMNRCSRN